MPAAYIISNEDAKKFRQMAADIAQAKKWIASLKVTGANFSNKADGATINVTPPPKVDPTIDDEDIYFIASSSRDGSNWRWTYQIQRQKKTAAAWAGWTSDGSATVPAYNFVERTNGASGVVSGYTLDSIITGIVPIATGFQVEIIAKPGVDVSGTPTTEFWFDKRNDPIITCP